MFQIVHLWKKCTAKPLPAMADQAAGCLGMKHKSRRCFRSLVGLGLISVLGWVRAVEAMPAALSHPSRVPSQRAAFLLYDLYPWLRFGSVLAQGDR